MKKHVFLLYYFILFIIKKPGIQSDHSNQVF